MVTDQTVNLIVSLLEELGRWEEMYHFFFSPHSFGFIKMANVEG